MVQSRLVQKEGYAEATVVDEVTSVICEQASNTLHRVYRAKLFIESSSNN